MGNKLVIVDNRNKYRHLKWMQGKLIETQRNKSWGANLKEEYEYEEACRAYTDFNGAMDKLVYVYSSPAMCRANVDVHNQSLGKVVEEPWVTNL